MSRTTKQPTKAAVISTATAQREEASAALAEVEASLEAANAEQIRLRQANEAGDKSVTGMELVAAAAEIDRLTGLVSAARIALEPLCHIEQHALADLVIDEVLAEFDHDQVSDKVAELNSELTRIIGELNTLIKAREAACDEAGQKLKAAGAPVNTIMAGRLHYKPVKATEHGDALKPGAWEIFIDGDPVADRRWGAPSTSKECRALLEAGLRAALIENGWALPNTANLISRHPRASKF